MIVKVENTTLIIDETDLTQAIAKFPGGEKAFFEILNKIGACGYQLQQIALKTKGMEGDELREFLENTESKLGEELRTLLATIDELRAKIEPVFSATYVREELLNALVPIVIYKAKSADSVPFIPIADSKAEARLRASVELAP